MNGGPSAGFTLVEALLAMAVTGIVTTSAIAWFNAQTERELAESDVHEVRRAADLWWLDEYGYTETVEFHCVKAEELDARERDRQLACDPADSADGLISASELMKSSPAATGRIVPVRNVTSCATAIKERDDAVADERDGKDADREVTGGNWTGYLREPLSAAWTLALDPTRITGELRHRDLHSDADSLGIPWSAPAAGDDAAEILFGDLSWVGFSGEQVHAGSQASFSQVTRSCLGQIKE